MSNGILIPAFNSTTSDGRLVDYVRLATINARLIKRYMNVPVAIMTDIAPDTDVFDEVVLTNGPNGTTRTVQESDSTIKFEWKNDVRIDAYDLSPFTQTIMIDADYLVLENRLLQHFDCNIPYYMPSMMRDITSIQQGPAYIVPEWAAAKSIPMRWATVLYFGKGSSALFDAAKIVRDHYPYYANLLGFSPKQFRNDYVFSIANWIINPSQWVTGSINAIPPSSHIVAVRQDYGVPTLIVDGQPGMGKCWTSQSVHLMSKQLVTTPEHLDILEQL